MLDLIDEVVDHVFGELQFAIANQTEKLAAAVLPVLFVDFKAYQRFGVDNGTLVSGLRFWPRA